VVLVFNPLSIPALSDLLEIHKCIHCITLSPLPSHCSNKSMTNPIHVLHKSFPDFLTDPQRCTDKQFFIILQFITGKSYFHVSSNEGRIEEEYLSTG
jgi:hypothetical protein